MAKEIKSTWLIKQNGIINTNVDKDLKLVTEDSPVAVVSVIGGQSSGKSTLCNCLFGTDFKEMDALKGRFQTTKGNWVAKKPLREGCLLLLDTEGRDGSEHQTWIMEHRPQEHEVPDVTQQLTHMVLWPCLCFNGINNSRHPQLMAADCSQFKDWGENSEAVTVTENINFRMSDSFSGWRNKRNRDGLFDIPVKAGDPLQEPDSKIMGLVSNAEVQKNPSSLGLLALTYGNSSDSDEDDYEPVIHNEVCKTNEVWWGSGFTPVSSRS